MKSPDMIRAWARHHEYLPETAEMLIRSHNPDSECITLTFRTCEVTTPPALLIYHESLNLLVAIESNRDGFPEVNVIPAPTKIPDSSSRERTHDTR